MMSYLLKQNAQVQEPKEDAKMASFSKVADAIFLSLQSRFYGEKDISFHGGKNASTREHNQGSAKFEIESALFMSSLSCWTFSAVKGTHHDWSDSCYSPIENEIATT